MKQIQLFLAIIVVNGLNAQFNFNKIFVEQNTKFNNETAVGDFDKNGELDIIVTSYSGNEVNIYFQKNKVLSKKTILSNITNPSEMEVADFDKDGDLDFVISLKPTSNHFIYVNDGTGLTFTQKLAGSSGGAGPVAINKADFNKDGYMDFIVGYAPAGIKMFINKKDNTFDKYNISTDFKRPGEIVVQDFNKDNRLDLIVTSFFGNEASIFWGTVFGFNDFTPESIDKTITSPIGAAITDINNDGKNDIVMSSFGSNKLYYYTYDGTFFYPKKEISSISSPTNITILDLNKDGFNDIVTYEQGKSAVKIFTTKNNGTTFETVSLDDTNEPTSGMTFLDWDKDNDIDIIVPCKTKMMIFENKLIVSSSADVSGPDVNIFPNPTSTELSIKTEAFLSCQVIDLGGRVILHSNSENVDVSLLQSGIYTMIINTLHGKATRKITKI